ncbi:MAG: bifunctional DNA-binding transcriptional regulator/O6-methylguanine-DNA methyltransferase Ada [Novosphingobium sp.]
MTDCTSVADARHCVEVEPAPLIAGPVDADRAWQAVLARDHGFDGRFVTGVLSTGIYCRPSCPARHPLRANVRFFARGGEARAAGLRPCRRCSPDDVSREERAVSAAIAAIREAGEPLALAELAQEEGYSPAHFQRLFTRAVGLSPAAYARALRMGRAVDALSAGGRVTDAVYDAGFAAPSRFYAASSARLGMAPSAWRDGGRGVAIRWALAPTTLGAMLVAATDRGVCRLAFGENAADLARRFPRAELIEGGEAFATLLGEVIAAVEQPGGSHHIPLDVRGTVFQEAVWRALRTIPPGETRSYAQLAAEIGSPGAVRAAGSANGANPVAVLIPCHRVVRSDGSIGGYAYRSEIKRALLEREQKEVE